VTRGALELRGFLTEVLVGRRRDSDVVEYDVLERKKSRKRVREVGSVEAKVIVQWNDLEGVGLTEKRRRSRLAVAARRLWIWSAWRRWS
jgi:hypothetical protein